MAEVCKISRYQLIELLECATPILKSDINAYKVTNKTDYNKGGFYMITDGNRVYIGKSIDYMSRLKCHLYKSTDKMDIDILLNKEGHKFCFYLIASYSLFGINFFNRKLETIIEQTLIAIANDRGLPILNKRIYGHLQII